MHTFPVDEVTLIGLRASCKSDFHDLGEDGGRSGLFDFLEFGAVVAEEREIEPGYVEVKYEPGKAPWSPQSVIVALVDEIERLRAAGCG